MFTKNWSSLALLVMSSVAPVMATLTVRPAAAQTCARLCRGCTSHQEASSQEAQAELYRWLDSLVASEALAMRRMESHLPLMQPSQPVLEALRNRIRTDAEVEAAARILASMFHGEDDYHTADQARLAAILFAELHLPVWPVAYLLSARETGVIGRTNAAIALYDRWADTLALSAARVALCIMDSRTPDSSTAEGLPTLDAIDQLEVNYLRLVLDGIIASGVRYGAHLGMGIRPGGSLGRYIQTFYPELW